jgi:hypothetical protein
LFSIVGFTYIAEETDLLHNSWSLYEILMIGSFLLFPSGMVADSEDDIREDERREDERRADVRYDEQQREIRQEDATRHEQQIEDTQRDYDERRIR